MQGRSATPRTPRERSVQLRSPLVSPGSEQACRPSNGAGGPAGGSGGALCEYYIIADEDLPRGVRRDQHEEWLGGAAELPRERAPTPPHGDDGGRRALEPQAGEPA
eukprot:7264897-Lingulodinium_polyedra.AAC.1